MSQVLLEADYDHCRHIHRQYGTSYYFAAQFFDRAIRPSVHALYAFVRVPDEWVDAFGEKDRSRVFRQLEEYEQSLQQAVSGGWVDSPVLRAFADTARRHQIPLTLTHDFLNAMRADLTQTRYQTFADLQRYMWGSASVVGVMMCYLFGVTEPEPLRHAADLGVAMQLTNFLRDISEDWERGRVYLPQDELQHFRITEQHFRQKRVDEDFRQMMSFQIDRARNYFSQGERGIPMLPPSSQYPTLLGSRLYSRILDVIERQDYNVFAERARTSTTEKIRLAFLTYFAWRKAA